MAVADLVSIVTQLQAIGVAKIIVPNMPDLGLTPDYYGDKNATLLSQYFNVLLRGSLPKGVEYFNTFAFMHAVVANPAAYGFTDVSDPCFNGVTVCANPDQYLFWDGFHPTTAADRILASEIQSVPEPTTLVMFGSGVLALGGIVRRRLL